MMNRCLPLVLLAAVTLAGAAACVPAPDQDATTGPAGITYVTTRPDTNPHPSCTAAFPTGGHSGITTAHGTVTGTVAVTCNGTAHYASYLVTFGHSTGQDDVTYPGSTTFTSTRSRYQITARCAPGRWVLDITILATVDNTTVNVVTNGDQVTLTSADCR